MTPRRFLYALIALALIAIAYFVPWTGFGGRWLPDGTYIEPKSLWDWLELVVIPFTVGLALYLVARQEQVRDKERQQAQSMDASLEGYLDRMTNLLLDGKLVQSDPFSELRKVAASRTLTVLRSVDGTRKGTVIRFLHDANLIRASDPIIDLAGADLRGADLRGAELNETRLDRTNLQGADLTSASLISAQLYSSNLRNANLSGAHCYGAAFNNADLTEASLPRASLETTHFMGANLSSADLSNASLSQAHLQGANLSGALLVGADMTSADFAEAQWNESTQLDAKPRLILIIIREGAEGRDLHGANLSGARLQRARLARANLQNADFSDANLVSADLRGADLRSANLTRASLDRAFLQGADLSKSDLSYAALSYADISGANLEGATLEWAKLRGTKSDESTKIAPKWDLVRNILDPSTSIKDLRNADLSKTDLAYANLSGANLLAANLDEALINNANLSHASLKYATLRGTSIETTNLNDTDFTDALVETWSICNSTNNFEGATMPEGHRAGRAENLYAHHDWMSRTGQVEGMQPASFGHALSGWIPEHLYPAEGEPEEVYPPPSPFEGLRAAFAFPSGLTVFFDRFIVNSLNELREYGAWFHREMQPEIDKAIQAQPSEARHVLLVLAFSIHEVIPDTLERDYLQLFRLRSLMTRVVGVLFEEQPELKELFRIDLDPPLAIG